jgi:hypothetical protein
MSLISYVKAITDNRLLISESRDDSNYTLQGKPD